MAILNIPDNDAAIFRKLSELTESQFADLANGFGEIRASVSIKRFCERLSERVKSIPKEDLDDYVGLLCGLYPLIERNLKPAQKVSADIKDTLKEVKRFGFTPDEALLVENRMSKLLGIGKAIAVTAKAVDVATEQQNVFCGVKIYSDIRPVFSATADAIVGALVLHNLNISYHEGRDHKEIYFALENSELNELKMAIERAEKKAKQLQAAIEKSDIVYLE